MSVPTSVPKIDFSPATAEDYEELMSISSGLFNGTDYFPVMYHKWLKEPQRRMFVARCEGKVVGFECFIVVDDGTTAVVEGLRVAAEMRRRGVGGVIERFCWDVICSDYPEVIRVRFSRSENPPAIMVETCNRITCKAVIPVRVTADQLEAKLRLLESRVNNEDRSKKLSVLGPEEILRFFESKTKEQLLPGGLLVQGWFPIAAQKSNLDLLLKREIVWIYSHPGDSSDSASSSKVTPGSNGPQASPEGFLSLGSKPFLVPIADKVYYIDIDLFGNDPSCAKVHVLEQLKIGVKGLPSGSGILFIIYAEESLRTELVQLCEGLNIFYFLKEQNIFERETKLD
ncbi:histidine N-acetyltransferase-like [Bufo gargarizans]|uniref:histidine N-acetyltransferase-like n=1 Tax=Bufo gargarizans TaxID=30331 RepID=UPI001CF2B29D|nr:histidine N-acetyltransferase-like [Bufo gargarizans]XP_044134695.1 histidine N-acetyltransferase-like [Bufo gargarizans]